MLKLAVDNVTNWVFVTGVIRSGTTFLGTVLSFPLEVDYLHEPFHGGYSLPDKKPLKPRYVRPGTEEKIPRYHQQVAKLFSYDFGLTSSYYKKDPWTSKLIKAAVGSRGPFYLRLAKVNPFHRAAVIKDPVGKMLTEYLYLNFGVKPVIIIRHPVSLAASLRRVGWWPDVKEFAQQPHLVEDYFKGEEDFLNRDWPDPMLRSAAHWRACYKVLLAQARKYPDWQVVTHEELSQEPLVVFKRLYHALDLPWSEGVAAKVQRLTQGNGTAKARKGRVQDFKRNSAGIFEMRRDSIPKERRQAIFDVVENVALQVYDRDSFAID